jgi:hypothetical protein
MCPFCVRVLLTTPTTEAAQPWRALESACFAACAGGDPASVTVSSSARRGLGYFFSASTTAFPSDSSSVGDFGGFRTLDRMMIATYFPVASLSSTAEAFFASKEGCCQ